MQKKLNKKNQDHLVQALRINLLKRKEQQRSRISVSMDKQKESTFHHQIERGFLINIRLTPGAKHDEIKGIYTAPEGQVYLKVNVKSAPENNQANDALISFLASELHFPKINIALVKGEASRLKILLFQEGDAQNLSQKLEHLINSINP
jgi:uncharacterized protein (TIGR00251 family)